jgi:hypothetical protein
MITLAASAAGPPPGSSDRPHRAGRRVRQCDPRRAPRRTTRVSRFPSRAGQDGVGGAAIGIGCHPRDEAPHGHALQMMGKPAALPPDGGGQRRQLKPSPRRIGKCIHHGVIGEREPTFGLPRLVGHVSHHGRWMKHHAMTERVESSCIALVNHDDGRDEHRSDDGDEVQQRAEPAPRHRVDREQP